MAAPLGGAGLYANANALANSRTTAAPVSADPLADIVVAKGAIRAIPYSAVASAVKAGTKLGIGATGALKIEVRGAPMIYKRGRPGIVANEYIAYQLFAAMGARVPTSYLVVNVEAGGIPMAVLTEYLTEGLTVAQAFRDGIPTDEVLQGEYNDPRLAKPTRRMRMGERTELTLAIQSEFLFHALLLNWDAKNWENHMIVPLADRSGMDINHPYVLDPGGALFYRAMGEVKRRSDLSPIDIQELTSMPAYSADTKGKFYVGLTHIGTMKGVVCRKAATIDDAAVLRVVEEMRPLFGFLPRGADLPGLITGRLAYLRLFCAGGIKPANVNRAVSYSWFVPDDNTFRNRTLEETIARQRYLTTAAAMAEEAAAGLRMRGKRTVAAPTVLEPKNLERFRMYNRPVVIPRRHAGVSSYGLEYNSNSGSEGAGTEDSEKRGVYPKPHFTVRLDRSVDAERVRHSVLAMREDPAIDAWLRAQVAYIKGLSKREYHILSSYTKNGDVMVNNYLRGTLRADSSDLVRASLAVSDDNPTRPVALAYSLYDQYPTLTRDGRLQLFAGSELQSGLLGADGELDMDLIRDIMKENIKYFGNAANLGPLIEQYRRDLVAILERAPRPPHAFTVFRGIQNEAYLSSLAFRNVDFLSTSISPEWAVRLFTREINADERMVSRPYRCCVYELEVRPDVPCIYMQFVSEFQDEYEVLIAPGMSVSLEPTVRLKMMLDHKGGTLNIDNLKELFHPESIRHTKVAVVEGEVRRPMGVAAASAAAAMADMEEGSFEGLVAKYGRRIASDRRTERFMEAKPRSQMVGRNRTRRITNRNKRRNTRRRSGSGGL